MPTYNMRIKYSRDGKNWVGNNPSVKAENEISAIMQIQSKYPYVKDIKVMSVKPK